MPVWRNGVIPHCGGLCFGPSAGAAPRRISSILRPGSRCCPRMTFPTCMRRYRGTADCVGTGGADVTTTFAPPFFVHGIWCRSRRFSGAGRDAVGMAEGVLPGCCRYRFGRRVVSSAAAFCLREVRADGWASHDAPCGIKKSGATPHGRLRSFHAVPVTTPDISRSPCTSRRRARSSCATCCRRSCRATVRRLHPAG